MSPEVAELRQQLAELSAAVGSTTKAVVKNARQSMYAYLDDNLANWTAINDDEKFKDWLSLPDPLSGAIRHELLKKAYAANNGPRVAAFFKGFLSEEAAAAPQLEPAPQPAKPGKVPLVEFAAPGRARSAATATPAPVEKPSITRAQVTQFYADVAAGRYRGRDDEKNRLEKTIFDANREGRITA